MRSELFVGTISGTSVDATDAALVDFAQHPPRLLATRSAPTPARLRAQLEQLVGNPNAPAIDAWRADAEVGELCARVVLELLAEAGVAPSAVAAIGSHGQTVWHAPDETPAFTVQLGDPSRIAAATGIATVADFRRLDMAFGGEGAPLAPALHADLFSDDRSARGVLNLGGIANLTVLPARGTGGAVLGFDTGPANTLLDGFARRVLGEQFDRDGALAARGRVDAELLAALRDEAYFARPPPKSTGRELFNMTWFDARGGQRAAALADADVMRTLVALTATTVADALSAQPHAVDAVFACGGGTRNPTLMRALADALAPTALDTTAAVGLDPRWVEAVTFAWLARRTLRGEPGNLPSVTGARRATSLGGVFRA